MTGKEGRAENPKQHGRMRCVYRAGRCFCRAFVSLYFRWRIFTPERTPLHGPLILAANHESYIDPVVIGSAVSREVHYLAREPAFRFPVLGDILRCFNAIPIDQENSASSGLKAGIEVLRGGQALVLFPEGSRTFDGNLQPFRSGVGLIVAKAKTPVLPIRLFGLHKAYGRHLLLPRPRRISIKIGHPLYFDDKLAEADYASKARVKEIYQEIADEIQAAVATLRPDDES